MKLKHYSLWALAFAFAAVSCSDDLDNPNKGNENPDGNGSSTYMKVTVNTGIATRATSDLPPTGGEEGDGNEVGLVNEYLVGDVTAILYKNVSEEGKNNTHEDKIFDKDSKIVGVGYAKTSGAMGPGDDPLHSKSATVLVTAKDDEDFDGNTYGVIAVTNWGDDGLKKEVQGKNLNATQLANLLVQQTHKNENGTKRYFIMSSHNKDGETVKLDANATEQTAPSVSVHVERLAAKVRINPDNQSPNYLYQIKRPLEPDGNPVDIAKVRLDQVVLVNKLKTGSYLLKRVTSGDHTDNIIPELSGDLWLGDETAVKDDNNPDAGTLYPGTNYVIDPWTRAKIVVNDKILPYENVIAGTDDGTPYMMGDNTTVPTLNYDNIYDGTKNFTALWSGLNNTKQLNAETTNPDAILIDYTMENTTSAVASKNGYSTGALFKAVYLPKQWSATTQKDGKNVVAPVDVTYDNGGYDAIGHSTVGQTFYVYQANIYQDWAAIFNEFVWDKQKPLESQSSAKIYSYDDFTSNKITDIKLADFAKSYLCTETAADPISYIVHLRTYINQYEKDANFANMKFSAAQSIDNYVVSTDNKEKVYANVKKYENGETYYPYWIRHANNGKPTEMGIMEFGIVRNNIYDMTVKDISGLGLSGTDMPDPDKDDESKEYRFNVHINVKNWVIRDNSGIIL